MEVEFNGMVAETNKIKYSVKQNNNSNVIVFKIAKNQDQIILDPTKHFYVKVQSCMCKDFFDKDPRAVITEDANNIYVAWTMKRKHTQFKNIDVQIQYEVASQDIVWQTSIINIDLFATIPADKEIENKYPSILTFLQEQLDDHEARIQALEQGSVVLEWGNITGNIENQEDLMAEFQKDRNAIEEVVDSVDNEKDAREQADSVLSQAIDDEALAREQADQALQEKIEGKTNSFALVYSMTKEQIDWTKEIPAYYVSFNSQTGKREFVVIHSEEEFDEIVIGLTNKNSDFNSLEDDLPIAENSYYMILGQKELAERLTLWVIKGSDLVNLIPEFSTIFVSEKEVPDRWLIDGVFEALETKTDLSNYYTKDEIDEFLSEIYTKTEVDASLEEKANDVDVLHKTGEETLTVGANSAKKSEIIQGIFNIINVRDMPDSTHLSNAQLDVLTNGKNTIFKGKVGTIDNMVILQVRNETNRAYFIGCSYSQGIFSGFVNKSSNNLIQFQLNNSIRFSNIGTYLMEKQFPAYPTSPANDKVLGYTTSKTLAWLDMVGALEFDPTKYIILQGSKFIQVDQIPQDYTGLGYQFGETGLQVLYFRNGVDTGITASIENDTITLTNGSGHTISMNSNTGKILIDSDQAVVSNNVAKVIKLTQQEYDDLETKDSSTLYIIVG